MYPVCAPPVVNESDRPGGGEDTERPLFTAAATTLFRVALFAGTLLLALSGAVLGIVAAMLLLPVAATLLESGFSHLPVSVILEALVIAVMFGAVAGFLPIRRAQKLSIVEALGGQ